MVKFVERDMYDNSRFYEHLSIAIDNAEQAISNITYSSYPELNKEVIDKIKKVCEILEDIRVTDIKKPM